MEIFFEQHEKNILIVKNYLLEIDCEMIVVTEYFISRGELVSLSTGIIPVEENALEAMKYLLQYSYGAYKEGNGIGFVVRRTREHTHGIIYTIDGNRPTQLAMMFLRHLEPLSKEGWYYYMK